MQQECEMLNFYCTEIATGLKNYDETQGISEDLETYKKAIRYDLSGEIFDVTRSTSDYAAYLELLVKSTKDCY